MDDGEANNVGGNVDRVKEPHMHVRATYNAGFDCGKDIKKAHVDGGGADDVGLDELGDAGRLALLLPAALQRQPGQQDRLQAGATRHKASPNMHLSAFPQFCLAIQPVFGDRIVHKGELQHYQSRPGSNLLDSQFRASLKPQKQERGACLAGADSCSATGVLCMVQVRKHGHAAAQWHLSRETQHNFCITAWAAHIA